MDSRGTVIKVELHTGELAVVMTAQTKYGFTKAGRGTVKCVVKYHLQLIQRNEAGEIEDSKTYLSTSRKSDALKMFRMALKYGTETYEKMIYGKTLSEVLRGAS